MSLSRGDWQMGVGIQVGRTCGNPYRGSRQTGTVNEMRYSASVDVIASRDNMGKEEELRKRISYVSYDSCGRIPVLLKGIDFLASGTVTQYPALRDVGKSRRLNSADNYFSMATLEEIPKVVLQVTAGPQTGERFEFTDHQTCIIGRSREAQIRLSDNRQFSRIHCRLEVKPPSVFVIDLRSTNGTRVNGKRVETASLNDGDIVTVGDTAFTVSVEIPKEKCSLPAQPSLVNRRLEPTNFAANDGFFSADDNPASSPLPEIPGYVIERELGQGAMGAVYSARLRSTNELVAIKVMKPVVVTSRKAVEKFRREACIGLRLQHKRIVRFIDFGVTDEDLPYLVMEYIDAFNIREYLNSLELAERIRVSVGIVVRTLEGLQFAHSQKIVHRDVKPANILVYRSGQKLQVKLADFGLAKNFVNAGFSNCSASDEICGTLAYMPPEQIVNCRYAKPPCDIYAAGVCLYHLISNHLPYEATRIATQISLILNQSPTPITHHVSELRSDLVGILDKTLSREPGNRYHSAEALRKALLPFSRR
jgi:eukaryotic-like serine/threonine-protein kinase